MKQMVLLTIMAVISMVSVCQVFAEDWILCANEHQECIVPGTKMVSYGAGDRWVSKLATHRVRCGNEVFGDPAPGIVKACFYTESYPKESEHRHGRHHRRHWEKCAIEGEYCQFYGQREVRYGAGDRWTGRTAIDGVHCGNDVFGDPAPGVVKACHVKVGN